MIFSRQKKKLQKFQTYVVIVRYHPIQFSTKYPGESFPEVNVYLFETYVEEIIISYFGNRKLAK